MDVEAKIWEFALENALKFKGKANLGAVIGKLMSADPSIKSQMKEVSGQIQSVIKEISAMPMEEIEAKLLQYNPDYFSQQQEQKEARKEARSDLPELSNAEEGKVITRIAPEPSKYAHVGHALSFLINALYADKYKGSYILRFDDTNPEKASQEYVDAMLDDIQNYLGLKPSKIVYASDDMDKFMEFGMHLIDQGHAYVCTCKSEDIAAARKEMKPCVHRNVALDVIKQGWNDMISGANTEAVLRLKGDMQHKNAVMRDPVIYRVVLHPHYRVGDKFKVWPMYDFETTIEEGIHGVTHVMRSNEFDSRIELQHYIANLLGFDEVSFKHYGRFSITGATTQGREIREKIESGEYLGWDDPRLVTLRALKRRGIVPETFRRLVYQGGMSKTQTNLDFTLLASINRQILDSDAKRFFFVKDPVKIHVANAPNKSFVLGMHPQKDLGGRRFDVSQDYYVSQEDFNQCKDGALVRLMDNLNFSCAGDACNFVSEDYQDFRDGGSLNIQYVPEESAIGVEVMMPDRTIVKGVGEHSLSALQVGEVIQFQRFGFCRLDNIQDGVYHFWYTHD